MKLETEKMPKLGFGLMRLPLQEAGDPKKIDQETLNRAVQNEEEVTRLSRKYARSYHRRV